MSELEAAQQTLRQEREASARALRAREAEHGKTLSMLSALQAAYAELRREYEAARQALRRRQSGG